MPSKTAILFTLIMLVAGHAIADGNTAIGLVIKPEKATYTLDEAGPGGVTINARFINGSNTPLFIVHPVASVPDSYDGKETFDFDEREGKSEILVYITGPKREETVLRNNALRGFEPGNVFGLHIPQGGSVSVKLGFFGPYFALGMWDGFDGPVFREPGEYRIKVVYRNRFGKALSFGTGGKIFEVEKPWTGEAVSNEITIMVR